MSPRQLLTVKEAAEELRVKDGTIYAMVRRGELKAVKYCRRTRIRRHDLDAFLNRHTVG